MLGIKYQWESEEYRIKAQRYTYGVYAMMVGFLVSLLMFPDATEGYNLLFLAVGVICWIMAYRLQVRDRKLKGGK